MSVYLFMLTIKDSVISHLQEVPKAVFGSIFCSFSLGEMYRKLT